MHGQITPLSVSQQRSRQVASCVIAFSAKRRNGIDDPSLLPSVIVPNKHNQPRTHNKGGPTSPVCSLTHHRFGLNSFGICILLAGHLPANNRGGRAMAFTIQDTFYFATSSNILRVPRTNHCLTTTAHEVHF